MKQYSMLQDLGCFMDEIMFKYAMTLKVKNQTLIKN